ncbi:MAG: DUF2752 domain-containing protein [Geobacteraceae bacterium]|nr:DUF2752 domain-containing protein [Geobacteraceae bacterium]
MWRVRLAAFISLPVLFALLPTSYIDSLPDICLFRQLFNVECPGCGMTRAISSILHGDLGAAIRFNRSVLVVFPLLCYVAVFQIWQEMKMAPWAKKSAALERNADS